MKKLKFSFVFAIGLIGMQLTQAQTSNQEKETIIITEKKDEKIVKHQGITFYVINGIWHTKMKNKYVLRAAPKGAVIDELPKGGENVRMAGKMYYKCKGVFYKKIGKKYQVARP